MMRRWRAGVRRLLSLFQRDRLDRDLTAELDSHLALHIDDNVRAGMTPDEARRAALLKLGGVAQVTEDYRRHRGMPVLEHLARDVRLGLRALRHRPGFTVVAVLTLGIGIGVNAAIFGVLNAVLFQPLAVAEPYRLVMLNRGPGLPITHSYPDYRDLRDRTRVLSGVVAYRFAPMNLGAATPARIWGYLATGNYFEVLGVPPFLGRTFDANDDRTAGAHPVVVLSYACWQRRFAADQSVVGRTVLINATPYTILGVMPRAFRGTELFFAPEVWVPMSMQAAIEGGNDWLERRQSHNIFVMGRLASGIALAQAESSLNVIAADMAREYPSLNEGMRIELSPPGLAGNVLRGPVIGFAAALLVVAALVLLMACTNLTGLLLARVADTQLDRAVRLALGATGKDLVRRALVDSTLVGAGAAAIGLALTYGVSRALSAWQLPVDFPLTAQVGIDSRVVAFVVVLGALSALLIGLVPAVHGRRTDIISALRDDQIRTRSGWNLRDLIVAIQVAIALVLLVGSLLIVRSLQRAIVIDLGFNPKHAVSLRVDVALQGYDGDRGRAFAPQILERLEALPGIESAGITSALPLSLDVSNHRVFIEGRPEPRGADVPSAIYYQVTPGFLRTMQTRFVAGRDFGKADTPQSPRVAIVNQAFVTRLLGDVQPLGKRFRTGRTGDWIEIVGVVQNGKYQSLGEEATPVVFHPLAQWYNPTTTIVARTSLEEGRAMDLLRRAVRELDPQLALFEDGPLSKVLALPFFPIRVAAGALSLFGVLSIALVSIGTYGLVSFSIARRAREICIRIAIGASRGNILRVTLGRVALIGLGGGAAGLAVAFAGAPLIGPLLFGVSPRDPGVFVGGVVLLAIVTATASWWPARRALNSEPASLLRQG